jgi:hypothetical protein
MAIGKTNAQGSIVKSNEKKSLYSKDDHHEVKLTKRKREHTP